MVGSIVNFWQFIVDVFWIYVFIAYLMVLFGIFRDIFADHKLHGVLKAIWIIVLVFIPFLGALIYLISRHKGMQERAIAAAQAQQAQTTDYIRTVAGSSGSSAADDIAKAKALLDAGTITQAEFEKLKAAALGTPQAAPVG
jgi:Short C-terminal domain/Phospholipase_D-nuclease N-terminal